MAPDTYCNLNIVNGTNQEIVVSPNGDAPLFNSQYQMNSWFPENPGVMLIPMMGTDSFKLQFLKGVGDEDDSANSIFSLNGDPNLQLVHFMGESSDDSGHYFQYQLIQYLAIQ